MRQLPAATLMPGQSPVIVGWPGQAAARDEGMSRRCRASRRDTGRQQPGTRGADRQPPADGRSLRDDLAAACARPAPPGPGSEPLARVGGAYPAVAVVTAERQLTAARPPWCQRPQLTRRASSGCDGTGGGLGYRHDISCRCALRRADGSHLRPVPPPTASRLTAPPHPWGCRARPLGVSSPRVPRCAPSPARRPRPADAGR